MNPDGHFPSLAELDRDELTALLATADARRDERAASDLRGRSIALLFLAPSLRTRASMELAAQQLGAHVVQLTAGQGLWGFEVDEGVTMDGAAAEHIKEAARVLGRYADLIALRAFPLGRSWAEDAQDKVLRSFMRWAGKPILNLESCRFHPCQGLADLLTIQRECARRGRAAPKKVVLSWAPHPKALPVAVPSSFAIAVRRMGWPLTIARPEGYDLPEDLAPLLEGAEVTDDREAALAGADVVYAKSWGRLDLVGDLEAELADRRARGLASWQVTADAMARTDDAAFLHCLPVRRNVVVSDAVLDSPRSLVFEQAENRLHVQKAILLKMLGGRA